MSEELDHQVLSVLSHTEWRYTIQIHDSLEAKEVFISLGTMYEVLDRFIKLGFVETQLTHNPEDPEDRDGKRKKWFILTSDGTRRRWELDQAKPADLPQGEPATNRSLRMQALALFLKLISLSSMMM